MRPWARTALWLLLPSCTVAAAGDDEVHAAADLRQLDCATCHAAIDAQWRESLHAHAWTDPIVKAEYARSPAASCRECHAPALAAEASRGIDCAACHVRDGVIVATTPSLRGIAAHPMRAEPALAEVDACGGCHQFDFTDDGIHDPSEALQNTVREWEASREQGGRTCQSCHMPSDRTADGATHTSHRLRGLDDPTLLAEAVEVRGEARRTSEGIEVAIVIGGDRIGHAFPTGDLFREAVLDVRTEGGAHDSLVLKRWLATTIDADGNGHHMRTVDDTRVPPPGVGVLEERFVLADPNASRVHWELRLHRLSPAAARARGLDDHAPGIPVAKGEIAVHDPR